MDRSYAPCHWKSSMHLGSGHSSIQDGNEVQGINEQFLCVGAGRPTVGVLIMSIKNRPINN